jgi:hypothetical protein
MKCYLKINMVSRAKGSTMTALTAMQNQWVRSTEEKNRHPAVEPVCSIRYVGCEIVLQKAKNLWRR